MEALEAIFARRSVRSYQSTPVPEELVNLVLQAAFSAPSGHNVRPWHIVVVTDPSLRRGLARTHRWSFFCHQAPVVLVVCGDQQKSPFWIEDCAAATENALIAAAAVGLGSCWIGIRQDPGSQRHVRELLQLPENLGVLSLVTLGYPAEETIPRIPDLAKQSLTRT